MPLDPSIFAQVGQGVTPVQNPLDTMSRVMAFKQLANKTQMENQQFQDEQAMRHAYANNTTVDQNGSPSLDRQGMLKDLAQSSPSLVPKAAQSFQSMDYEMQKQNISNHIEKLGYAGQVLGAVQDQATYDNAKKQAQMVGADTSQWPPQYDPNWVQHAQYQSMNAKDQLEAHAKQQGIEIQKTAEQNKAKELQMAMNKQYGIPIPKGVTPDTNPAVLIKDAPQEHQAEITKEVGLAQSTAHYLPKLLKAMDDAHAKIQSGYYTPEKYNDSINAIRALAAPLVKDVQGGNKQAAVDALVESIKPENKDKLTGGYNTKRQAAIDFAMGNMNAPASMNAGIDLKKFKSTSIDPSVLSPPGAFSSDVLSYAQKHGITADQAQSIKNQRSLGNR